MSPNDGLKKTVKIIGDLQEWATCDNGLAVYMDLFTKT